MKYNLTVLIALLSAAFGYTQGNAGKTFAMFHSQGRKDIDSWSGEYKPVRDVRWKFKTGGKVFSSPAVLNGIVVVGSEDKSLYAINAKSGKMVWKFTTGGAVHSSPAIYNNTVYFGSHDGFFYALNFTTGKQKWKFRTGGEKRIGDTSYWGMKPAGMYMEDPWDCFLSSPYVDTSGNTIVYFGSSDGSMYAINGEDGSAIWKFKAKGSIHTSPALYKGNLYFGSWDTYFYAVDAKTGTEIWKFKTGDKTGMAGIQASAAVENGVVYFGARDANFYALDADKGNLLWKYDAGGSWVVSSAVIDDGLLYTGTSDSYLLLALDIQTGKEKYRFKTNGYVFGTPAIVGSTAYFGDFTGKMYSLDLKSGGKRWDSFATDARLQNAAAVLKNDTLDFMFAAKGGDLAYYPVSIKVMDEFYKLGSIVSSPAVRDDIVYFGSADGYIYAVKLEVTSR